MRPLEFVIDLNGESVLEIPRNIAEQLPKEGRARVLVLVDDDSEDTLWRRSAYEQFMRDDGPEDSVYDDYR
jgi:hypothetical protein